MHIENFVVGITVRIIRLARGYRTSILGNMQCNFYFTPNNHYESFFFFFFFCAYSSLDEFYFFAQDNEQK